MDFAGIQARFGSPNAIAAAYVDDMNTEELLHALRVTKKIVTAVVTGIIVALLLWASAVSLVYIQNRIEKAGPISHYVIE